MVKQRWKKKGMQGPAVQADADPTTRSIAIHGDSVAVAAGKRWRVVNIRSGSVLQDNCMHDGAVRSVAFSPNGQYLVTCGDDKTACVWRTTDWACVHRLRSSKKAMACTFSADSQHVFFADRFGDVLCATTKPTGTQPSAGAAAAAAGEGANITAKEQLPVAVEASLLLGHLQSIVTSLNCCGSSTGQQLLVSTDKDGKVRASILPAQPTQGSFEIQAYCLGHTKFVACAAAVPVPADTAHGAHVQQRLVISGGGDGTIRLWDVDSGKQLSCYVASEQPPSIAFQQQQEQVGAAPQQGAAGRPEPADADSDEGEQQEGDAGEDATEPAAVEAEGPASESKRQQSAAATAAAAAAAAAGGDSEGASGGRGTNRGTGKYGGKYQKLREACCAVLSLAVSPDGTTVAAAVEGQQELQLLALDTTTQTLQLLQTLAFSDVANPAAVAFDSSGRLWVVGGVLARSTESAHVGVAAQAAGSNDWQVVTSAVLPDTARSALELRVPSEEQQQQQQQEGYYFEGMKRAVYIVEGAKDRKKQRRDLRDIERLRALTAERENEQQQQQQQQQQQEGAQAAPS